MKNLFFGKCRDQKGFTLLEMLIAVTLIAIGLLATASMQGVALRSNSIANRLTVANLLAQKVIEDLHSRSANDAIYLNASPVTNVQYILDPVTSSPTITIPGAGVYSATYSITPNATISSTLVTGTTRIDVTVSYIAQVAAQTVTKAVTYTSYKMVL